MGDKKARGQRSPPDDKQLSLEKDCRHLFPGNNKAARKNIPLFKARSNRRGRHSAKVAANELAGDGEIDQAEARLLVADQKTLKPRDDKVSDTPLGEVLQRKGKRPRG